MNGLSGLLLACLSDAGSHQKTRQEGIGCNGHMGPYAFYTQETDARKHVCVALRVCACVCVCVCVHICVCEAPWVYANLRCLVCAYIRVCGCLHACMCVFEYMRLHVSVHERAFEQTLLYVRASLREDKDKGCMLNLQDALTDIT